MSDLVVIAAYLRPWEAQMLRGRLEAEGIYAAVLDEQMTYTYGTDTGVRVAVRKDDAARALEIRQEVADSSSDK